MEKDITHYAKTRYSTKKFDPAKKITEDKIEKIKELLRYSASSTNAQPWHFILASSDEAKAKIVKATDLLYPFNSPSILEASHVVVFCSKLDLEEDYLLRVLEQEEKDGRFTIDPAFKEQQHAGRSRFANLHKEDLKDALFWMEKQTYLNLGAFLLGVSTLGIDAVAMEGVDTKALDEQFGLREKGFASRVVVPIGYRDFENDFNAKLPKSRLPYEEIITEV